MTYRDTLTRRSVADVKASRSFRRGLSTFQALVGRRSRLLAAQELEWPTPAATSLPAPDVHYSGRYCRARYLFPCAGPDRRSKQRRISRGDAIAGCQRVPSRRRVANRYGDSRAGCHVGRVRVCQPDQSGDWSGGYGPHGCLRAFDPQGDKSRHRGGAAEPLSNFVAELADVRNRPLGAGHQSSSSDR